MKKNILLIISIALVLSSFAVPSDIWGALAELQLKFCYNPETGLLETEPIPTEMIKNLDGKMIEIKGFVIQYEKHNLVLSRYSGFPDLCFSPMLESVIRIKTKRRIVSNPYKPCTLKGRFELKTTNLSELPYILNDAKCLDCEK